MLHEVISKQQLYSPYVIATQLQAHITTSNASESVLKVSAINTCVKLYTEEVTKKLQDLFHKSKQIRKSYERLPFQGFWTWLTGKEIQGRDIKRNVSAIECTAWSTLIYLAGIAASITIVIAELSPLWLILSILATISAARYIVATVIHHGVHSAIFHSERNNRILCEILSTLTIVQPYDSYKKFHVHEHHGKNFSTTEDKDLAAIYTLGIKPGVPVKHMMILLLWQCVSPKFHLSYFWGRLRSNLFQAPLYRRTMLVLWFALLAAIAWYVGAKAFIIGFVIPITVMYQVCSLIHLLTEHAWILRTENEKVRDSHIKNSHARFCGQELPSTNLKGFQWLKAWSHWWAAHLFLHLPTRLLVVQGSLIVHDWHHRAGTNRNWTQSIQLREVDVQREAAQGMYTYTDIWGIDNVIKEVLVRISQRPECHEAENLTYRLN